MASTTTVSPGRQSRASARTFTPSVVLDRRATSAAVYAEQAGGKLPRSLYGGVFVRAPRHATALIAGQ